MYELEIYRRIMCHDNEEWCENWRWIDLSVPCGHEQFEKFWPEHLKISKICTLVGSFWSKYKMFQLKKYRAVIFDGTQDWYQVWRKTDLCFRKLTWGIWWIFTRELESLQIGTLTASFCLKLKMYELEIYRRIMCHDNEEWCENLKNQICTLMGFFWTRYILVELKKYRGCLMALNIDAKFEGKMTCAFKNDMRNLANFHQSMFESLKIGTLMGSFYPK